MEVASAATSSASPLTGRMTTMTKWLSHSPTTLLARCWSLISRVMGQFYLLEHGRYPGRYCRQCESKMMRESKIEQERRNSLKNGSLAPDRCTWTTPRMPDRDIISVVNHICKGLEFHSYDTISAEGINSTPVSACEASCSASDVSRSASSFSRNISLVQSKTLSY